MSIMQLSAKCNRMAVLSAPVTGSHTKYACENLTPINDAGLSF